MDFEAFPLDESDHGGIVALLKQLLGQSSSDIDFNGLAELLIAQNPIGTVLKVPTPMPHASEFGLAALANGIYAKKGRRHLEERKIA